MAGLAVNMGSMPVVTFNGVELLVREVNWRCNTDVMSLAGHDGATIHIPQETRLHLTIEAEYVAQHEQAEATVRQLESLRPSRMIDLE